MCKLQKKFSNCIINIYTFSRLSTEFQKRKTAIFYYITSQTIFEHGVTSIFLLGILETNLMIQACKSRQKVFLDTCTVTH